MGGRRFKREGREGYMAQWLHGGKRYRYPTRVTRFRFGVVIPSDADKRKHHPTTRGGQGKVARTSSNQREMN